MTSENKNAYMISNPGYQDQQLCHHLYDHRRNRFYKIIFYLITSTIIKDFDGNANIGYVKNGLSSQANAQQHR